LGEDRSISFRETGVRKSIIRNIFTNEEKNIGKIYSPPGKFAEQAKQRFNFGDFQMGDSPG